LAAKPKKPKSKRTLYLGVDVGGTKILAAAARANGRIVASKRCPTPRRAKAAATVEVIAQLMAEVLAEAGLTDAPPAAAGLAIPGVVDPAGGRIVVTPNMNLSGFQIVQPLQDRFDAPVALGNDVNLGILGEQWLGAAQGADSAVGIFIGTGIGGGIIQHGRLVEGGRGAAGEIGHMMMDLNGPVCGCGARGCFEALASRTAIERDIRQAVAAGRKTILAGLIGPQGGLIKSSMLRRALEEKDKLVVTVMRRAAEIMGRACLNVRHLLDPEVIVLGGGVIEACEFFLMPIIRQAVEADGLAGSGPSARIAVSALGDEAVVLGAVALAQRAAGADAPGDQADKPTPYPAIAEVRPGEITVGKKSYRQDIFIRADGKVKKYAKVLAKTGGPPGQVGPAELKRICWGGPETLIIGGARQGRRPLGAPAAEFLRNRGISCRILSLREAIAAYNAQQGRKAALIFMTA